jgi:hypothetical protein
VAREIDACPICGLTYDAFRTGLTFGAVRSELFTSDPDPATWRQKRRSSVLGFWHERKNVLFRVHVQECEHYARLELDEVKSAADPQEYQPARVGSAGACATSLEW